MAIKAFFSRRIPFGLVPAEENFDTVGFDSYPVDTDERTLRLAAELRALAQVMQEMYDNMPAPEEAAQTEADYLKSNLESIIVGYNNG